MKLLPRLNPLAVRKAMSTLPADASMGQISETMKKLNEMVEWNASGGSKSTQEEIKLFHKTIVKIARNCGFQQDGKDDKARFDRQCAVFKGMVGRAGLRGAGRQRRYVHSKRPCVCERS